MTCKCGREIRATICPCVIIESCRQIDNNLRNNALAMAFVAVVYLVGLVVIL